MLMDVIGDRMIRSQRCGQDERQLILTNRVADSILGSRFRPGIGETLKTKRRLIEMCRLFGVTDIKLDIISPLQRQKILFRCRSRFGFWSSNCRWHISPPRCCALSAYSKYKIDNQAPQGCGGWGRLKFLSF